MEFTVKVHPDMYEEFLELAGTWKKLGLIEQFQSKEEVEVYIVDQQKAEQVFGFVNNSVCTMGISKLKKRYFDLAE